jgi:ABC-type nitrate/sulfonate/bicarbonate transport system ATPase subunit
LTVLSNLTLHINENSTLAMMGPNGCGKSTIQRVILGLEGLDGGSVGPTMEGKDLAGAVLQDYRGQLVPWLTVRQNILLACNGDHDPGVAPDAFLQRVAKHLGEMGFDILMEAPAGHLSGGEAQALVFARAMAFEARVWLLDEPFAAVDLKRRPRCLDSLRKFARGRTVLFTTHDLSEALSVADHLLVLDIGGTSAGSWAVPRDPSERTTLASSVIQLWTGGVGAEA